MGDVRHDALEKTGGDQMYIPIRQNGDYSVMDLVVRTALPSAALASVTRAAVRLLDPNLATEFRTLPELVIRRFHRGNFWLCCSPVLLLAFLGSTAWCPIP